MCWGRGRVRSCEGRVKVKPHQPSAQRVLQTMRAIRPHPGAKRGVLALMLGAGMLLATACGASSPPGSGSAAAQTGSSSGDLQASQAVVNVAPGDGVAGVATRGALKISAAQGKLTSVQVEDTDGGTVPGTISSNGTSWTPRSNLSGATHYVVDAIAKDAQGHEAARTASFTTAVPKNTFIGYFNVDPGATYGVGEEVSLSFTHPITNEKAVENALTVTSTPSVPIVGHWFGNQRLDFRPQRYWAPGTQVMLHLRLRGVQGAPGYYGAQSKDVHFSIGRNQISYVNASTHMMRVTQDGRTIKTVPITAGAPGKTTWNGAMVISEKDPVTEMNGSTVGYGGEYDIKDVPHAMRLTRSGTFIHGNYWSAPSVFGHTNVSHGCVSMRDARGGGDPNTPAAWFYNHSLIGDVVVVSNSPDKTVQPDNGFNGWNMPWSQWAAGMSDAQAGTVAG
jgi:lipoprotein-anchoring transpeptidase ErfK/SrfK